MLTAYDIASREHDLQIQKNENLKFGFVAGDPDNYYPLSMGDGTARLMPGPEFNSFLYRGQTDYFSPCLPSIYRGKQSKTDILIKWMKILQFKQIVSQHPAIPDFTAKRILGNSLAIDYTGIAQHYGLATELLDFTSSPWVAAFFATTEFDQSTQRYYPARQNNKGLFYRLRLDKLSGFSQDQVEILGFQPFKRPTMQKAFSCCIKQGKDLHKMHFVEYEFFKHDYRFAEKIYEKFEGGDALHTPCPVSKRADEINKQETFQSSIFEDALKIIDINPDQKDNILSDLHSKGINITDSVKPYCFTEAELAELKQEWEQIKQTMRFSIRPVVELKQSG